MSIQQLGNDIHHRVPAEIAGEIADADAVPTGPGTRDRAHIALRHRRGPVRGDVGLGAAFLQGGRRARREQRKRMDDRICGDDRGAERRDLGVEPFPVAQHHRRVQAIATRLRERRLERERAPVGDERFLVTLDRVERRAEIGPRVGQLRRAPGRLGECCERLARAVQIVQREAAIRPRFGVVGIDRKRAVGARERIGEAAEPVQRDAAVAPRRAEGGRERERGIEAAQRFVAALRAVERQPEVVVEFGVLRRERYRLLEMTERGVVTTGFALDHAERAVAGRELRLERDRALVRRCRGSALARPVEDDAAVVVRLEIVRPDRDAARVEGERAREVARAGGPVAELEADRAEQREDALVGTRDLGQRLEQRLRLGEAALAAQRKRALRCRGDAGHAALDGVLLGEQTGIDLRRPRERRPRRDARDVVDGHG